MSTVFRRIPTTKGPKPKVVRVKRSDVPIIRESIQNLIADKENKTSFYTTMSVNTESMQHEVDKLSKGLEERKREIENIQKRLRENKKLLKDLRASKQKAEMRLNKYKTKVTKETHGATLEKLNNQIDQLRTEMEEIYRQTQQYDKKYKEEGNNLTRIQQMEGLSKELILMNKELTDEAFKLLDRFARSGKNCDASLYQLLENLQQQMTQSEQMRQQLAIVNPFDAKDIEITHEGCFSIDVKLKRALPLFNEIERIILNSQNTGIPDLFLNFSESDCFFSEPESDNQDNELSPRTLRSRSSVARAGLNSRRSNAQNTIKNVRLQVVKPNTDDVEDARKSVLHPNQHVLQTRASRKSRREQPPKDDQKKSGEGIVKLNPRGRYNKKKAAEMKEAAERKRIEAERAAEEAARIAAADPRNNFDTEVMMESSDAGSEIARKPTTGVTRKELTTAEGSRHAPRNKKGRTVSELSGNSSRPSTAFAKEPEEHQKASENGKANSLEETSKKADESEDKKSKKSKESSKENSEPKESTSNDNKSTKSKEDTKSTKSNKSTKGKEDAISTKSNKTSKRDDEGNESENKNSNKSKENRTEYSNESEGRKQEEEENKGELIKSNENLGSEKLRSDKANEDKEAKKHEDRSSKLSAKSNSGQSTASKKSRSSNRGKLDEVEDEKSENITKDTESEIDKENQSSKYSKEEISEKEQNGRNSKSSNKSKSSSNLKEAKSEESNKSESSKEEITETDGKPEDEEIILSEASQSTRDNIESESEFVYEEFINEENEKVWKKVKDTKSKNENETDKPDGEDENGPYDYEYAEEEINYLDDNGNEVVGVKRIRKRKYRNKSGRSSSSKSNTKSNKSENENDGDVEQSKTDSENSKTEDKDEECDYFIAYEEVSPGHYKTRKVCRDEESQEKIDGEDEEGKYRYVYTDEEIQGEDENGTKLDGIKRICRKQYIERGEDESTRLSGRSSRQSNKSKSFSKASGRSSSQSKKSSSSTKSIQTNEEQKISKEKNAEDMIAESSKEKKEEKKSDEEEIKSENEETKSEKEEKTKLEKEEKTESDREEKTKSEKEEETKSDKEEKTESDKEEKTKSEKEEKTKSEKEEKTKFEKEEKTESDKIEKTESEKEEKTESDKEEKTESDKEEKTESEKEEKTESDKEEKTKSEKEEKTKSEKEEKTKFEKEEKTESDKIEKTESEKEEKTESDKEEKTESDKEETKSENKEIKSKEIQSCTKESDNEEYGYEYSEKEVEEIDEEGHTVTKAVKSKKKVKKCTDAKEEKSSDELKDSGRSSNSSKSKSSHMSENINELKTKEENDESEVSSKKEEKSISEVSESSYDYVYDEIERIDEDGKTIKTYEKMKVNKNNENQEECVGVDEKGEFDYQYTDEEVTTVDENGNTIKEARKIRRKVYHNKSEDSSKVSSGSSSRASNNSKSSHNSDEKSDIAKSKDKETDEIDDKRKYDIVYEEDGQVVDEDGTVHMKYKSRKVYRDDEEKKNPEGADGEDKNGPYIYVYNDEEIDGIDENGKEIKGTKRICRREYLKKPSVRSSTASSKSSERKANNEEEISKESENENPPKRVMISTEVSDVSGRSSRSSMTSISSNRSEFAYIEGKEADGEDEEGQFDYVMADDEIEENQNLTGSMKRRWIRIKVYRNQKNRIDPETGEKIPDGEDENGPYDYFYEDREIEYGKDENNKPMRGVHRCRFKVYREPIEEKNKKENNENDEQKEEKSNSDRSSEHSMKSEIDEGKPIHEEEHESVSSAKDNDKKSISSSKEDDIKSEKSIKDDSEDKVSESHHESEDLQKLEKDDTEKVSEKSGRSSRTSTGKSGRSSSQSRKSNTSKKSQKSNKSKKSQQSNKDETNAVGEEIKEKFVDIMEKENAEVMQNNASVKANRSWTASDYTNKPDGIDERGEYDIVLEEDETKPNHFNNVKAYRKKLIIDPITGDKKEADGSDKNGYFDFVYEDRQIISGIDSDGNQINGIHRCRIKNYRTKSEENEPKPTNRSWVAYADRQIPAGKDEEGEYDYVLEQVPFKQDEAPELDENGTPMRKWRKIKVYRKTPKIDPKTDDKVPDGADKDGQYTNVYEDREIGNGVDENGKPISGLHRCITKQRPHTLSPSEELQANRSWVAFADGQVPAGEDDNGQFDYALEAETLKQGETPKLDENGNPIRVWNPIKVYRKNISFDTKTGEKKPDGVDENGSYDYIFEDRDIKEGINKDGAPVTGLHRCRTKKYNIPAKEMKPEQINRSLSAAADRQVPAGKDENGIYDFALEQVPFDKNKSPTLAENGKPKTLWKKVKVYRKEPTEEKEIDGENEIGPFDYVFEDKEIENGVDEEGKNVDRLHRVRIIQQRVEPIDETNANPTNRTYKSFDENKAPDGKDENGEYDFIQEEVPFNEGETPELDANGKPKRRWIRVKVYRKKPAVDPETGEKLPDGEDENGPFDYVYEDKEIEYGIDENGNPIRGIHKCRTKLYRNQPLAEIAPAGSQPDGEDVIGQFDYAVEEVQTDEIDQNGKPKRRWIRIKVYRKKQNVDPETGEKLPDGEDENGPFDYVYEYREIEFGVDEKGNPIKGIHKCRKKVYRNQNEVNEEEVPKLHMSKLPSQVQSEEYYESGDLVDTTEKKPIQQRTLRSVRRKKSDKGRIPSKHNGRRVALSDEQKAILRVNPDALPKTKLIHKRKYKGTIDFGLPEEIVNALFNNEDSDLSMSPPMSPNTALAIAQEMGEYNEMNDESGEMHAPNSPSSEAFKRHIMRRAMLRKIAITRLKLKIGDAILDLKTLDDEINDLEGHRELLEFERKQKMDLSQNYSLNTTAFSCRPAEIVYAESSNNTDMTKRHIDESRNLIQSNNSIIRDNSAIEALIRIEKRKVDDRQRTLFTREQDNIAIAAQEEELRDTINKYTHMDDYISPEKQQRINVEQEIEAAKQELVKLEQQMKDCIPVSRKLKCKVEDMRWIIDNKNKEVAEQSRKGKPDVPKLWKVLEANKAQEKTSREKLRQLITEEDELQKLIRDRKALVSEDNTRSISNEIDEEKKYIAQLKAEFNLTRGVEEKPDDLRITTSDELNDINFRTRDAREQIASLDRDSKKISSKIDRVARTLASLNIAVPQLSQNIRM